MTRFRFPWLASLALLAAGIVALPASASKAEARKPGLFMATDDGKLFSSAGLDKAKAAMNDAQFDHGLTFTIDTFDAIPAGKKAGFSDATKDRFFKEWARDMATSGKLKGIYVLVCRHPGYVEVLADKETHDRGFSREDEVKLRDTLLSAFRDATKESDAAKQVALRDAGLLSAVQFVITDLQGSHVSGHTAPQQPGRASTGMGIGGWLCIGLVALLGIWLVIGLFRAFTGGGGSGGMGGGGGGGFMTSLFGGLFGAMAGMWLYNSFFGSGGGLFGGGSDAYASDGYGGSGDTGAGDFSGDTGAGGGWDDGGAGGGFDGGGFDGGGGDF